MESPRPPVTRPRTAPPSFDVITDVAAHGRAMDDEMLRATIQQLLEAHGDADVTLRWRGIAPAPEGPAWFRTVLAHADELRRPGVTVRHVICADATQLGSEWAECLHDHQAIAQVALGVPAHARGGPDDDPMSSLFGAVRVIDELHLHHIDVTVVCTVNAASARHPVELYRFLRDRGGVQSIEWVPLVERDGDGVTASSVSAGAWGAFLIDVFDEWFLHDVGDVIVTNFDAALGKWLGSDGGPCIFEETCGSSLVLAPDGGLFSCDRFADDSHRLGDIGTTHMVELIAKPEQRRFGQVKHDTLPRYCLECPVRFACNGECPDHRFIRTPDGEDGLNVLCAGYRAFFTHVDRPMRTMVELVVQGRFIEEAMTLTTRL